MLGCWAEALSEDIVIDAEIEDARWVSRAEMAMALNGEHPHFASPRQDSIARWILTAWVAGEIAHDLEVGIEDDIAGAGAAC
jgi:NAD+ diphosphatase